LRGGRILGVTDPAPDPSPAPHRRRPRYKGKHPRAFHEKYKELAPERYPEEVEHVRARGMTPAGSHVSIMPEEVLAALAPRPGERGVDCTLGYGGHSQRILERLAPGGTLLALDVDPLELPKTEVRLRKLGYAEDALLVKRTNFAALRAAVAEAGWSEGVDFVFADLGVSSMQIDDPARGFSFKHEAALDMRMNPARGLSAAQWLERATLEDLARAFDEGADEPHARRIAAALVARRGSLRTTLELAEAVRAALPAFVVEEQADRSTRRVFQAVRIEVNDEFGVLDTLLRALPECLRAGGRAALLTFHSGEDRRVKKSFEAGVRAGIYAECNAEVVRASMEEQRANPRSSSAKLRWARRA
jgi:16S rRNA (cytosine1402-N4)-methyltransferase